VLFSVHEWLLCGKCAGLDETAEVQRKVLKDGEDESELTLKCHVEGNPEPNIVWTRNKQRCDTNHHVTTGQKGLYFDVYISHRHSLSVCMINRNV